MRPSNTAYSRRPLARISELVPVVSSHSYTHAQEGLKVHGHEKLVQLAVRSGEGSSHRWPLKHHRRRCYRYIRSSEYRAQQVGSSSRCCVNDVPSQPISLTFANHIITAVAVTNFYELVSHTLAVTLNFYSTVSYSPARVHS